MVKDAVYRALAKKLIKNAVLGGQQMYMLGQDSNFTSIRKPREDAPSIGPDNRWELGPNSENNIEEQDSGQQMTNDVYSLNNLRKKKKLTDVKTLMDIQDYQPNFGTEDNAANIRQNGMNLTSGGLGETTTVLRG